MKKRIKINFPVSEENFKIAYSLYEIGNGKVIDINTKSELLTYQIVPDPNSSGSMYVQHTDTMLKDVPPEFLEDIEEEKTPFQKARDEWRTRDIYSHIDEYGGHMWNAALDALEDEWDKRSATPFSPIEETINYLKVK